MANTTVIEIPEQRSVQAIEIEGSAPNTNPYSKFLDNPVVKLRCAIFIAGTCTIAYTKNHILPTIEAPCYHDLVFDKLEWMNHLVNTSSVIRTFLQITSSLLMDGLYLAMFVNWVFSGRSSRLIVAMITFYAVRGITMGYFLLGFPEGYTWDSPGFPSIIVPYGVTSDFFYSGHCGFLTILGAEWYTLGYVKMSIFTHITTVYMAFVMLVCRIHYSIDITTGIVFAHYIYIIIRNYSSEIDGFLLTCWNLVAFGSSNPPNEKRSSDLKEPLLKNDDSTPTFLLYN